MPAHSAQANAESIDDVTSRRKDWTFDASVLILCLLSFALSWIESAVNTDSHHWGFMYVPALDLAKGLAPYKETLIVYGYLTTLIQAFSLTLFGNSLKSIGIITGICYSLSLYLSYRVFLVFLSRPLSVFTVFLIVLLHPYVIHPWSNYISYTFELLALVLFLNGRTIVSSRFSPGVCLGLSVLARYSAAVAILPPFLIYLCYELFLRKADRKLDLRKMVAFGAGFAAPLVWFLSILLYHNALYDLYIQNRVIAGAWKRGITVWNFLPKLLKNILLARTWPTVDSRSVCFSVIFFCAAIGICYFGHKALLPGRKRSRVESALVMVSLVALFGYLNSVHIYQIFRLINGSSIGLGIVIYFINELSRQTNRTGRAALVMSAALLCFIWTKTLLRPTSSIYLPWHRSNFADRAVKRTEISMFQGKWLSDDYYGFYQEVRGILSKFDPSTYYVINYTWDPLLTVLSGLKRVQTAPFYLEPPFYLPFAEYGYRDEGVKVQRIIEHRQAVILATGDRKIAGYKLVFAKPWSKDTPWFAQNPGMKLYISVPAP